MLSSTFWFRRPCFSQQGSPVSQHFQAWTCNQGINSTKDVLLHSQHQDKLTSRRLDLLFAPYHRTDDVSVQYIPSVDTNISHYYFSTWSHPRGSKEGLNQWQAFHMNTYMHTHTMPECDFTHKTNIWKGGSLPCGCWDRKRQEGSNTCLSYSMFPGRDVVRDYLKARNS